jgi:response regulator RpfG family c-di-GMP phosphodiesterase
MRHDDFFIHLYIYYSFCRRQKRLQSTKYIYKHAKSYYRPKFVDKKVQVCRKFLDIHRITLMWKLQNLLKSGVDT